uniref:Glycosylphosphatidylinositol transamidase n=1 Tax=Panagrellus redivivus TaxID=6233 RepID=A0A7E4UN47_PANRE
MLRRITLQGSKTPKPIKKVIKHAALLAVIAYLGAFGYAIFATAPENLEATRISENAFLPGIVREKFNKHSSLSAFGKGLRQGFKNGNPNGYLIDALRDLGLEAASQKFAFKPLYGAPVSGETVYGILRTEKNPSVEAMVLVVPFSDKHEAVATLALTIIDYFKDQVYWARDIIFVFVPPEPVAMEAWLAAYHGFTVPTVTADVLQIRSGEIVGGYVFDFEGQYIKDVEFQFFGVNGRQPNLDLVNVAVYIAQFGLKFPSESNVLGLEYVANHRQNTESLLKSIWHQTFHEVQGAHSVFGSYGISAVTIKGKPAQNSRHGHEVYKFAIYVEALYRSFNNVLEKLHQSYFLYYLISPKQFMSVAYYMPILGCFIAALLFPALRELTRPAGYAIPASLIYNHILALGLYFLTMFVFTNPLAATITGLPAALLQKAVLLGAPIVMQLSTNLYPITTASEARVSRFVLFTEAGLLLGAVGLLTISPALLIGAIMVPLILLFTVILPTGPVFGFVAGIVAHPITLITGFVAQEPKSVPELIDAVYAPLASAVHNHIVHGSLLFPLYCLLILALAGHLAVIARFPKELLPIPPHDSDEDDASKAKKAD